MRLASECLPKYRSHYYCGYSTMSTLPNHIIIIIINITLTTKSIGMFGYIFQFSLDTGVFAVCVWCSYWPENLSLHVDAWVLCDKLKLTFRATAESGKKFPYTLHSVILSFFLAKSGNCIHSIYKCLFVCSIFYGFVLRVRQRFLALHQDLCMYNRKYLFASIGSYAPEYFFSSSPTISHTL